jgi:CRP/FNR family transcriptional regulator, cyclic AMP receptor protein
MLNSSTRIDLAARRAALGNCQLFKSLSAEELEVVLSRATLRRVARNAPILRRGDLSPGLAVILVGHALVSMTSASGKEASLAVLGPDEVLGEMSVLDGEECSADVTAQEDCVLLTVERDRFIRLLRSNADLCLRLMVSLCGRLRRANALLEDMTSLDLPSRLARLLSRLARDYGVAGPRGTRIGLKLSQKDLGALVGGSREKVNKQLRCWEDDGVIGKVGGHIVILQPDVLEPPK